MNKRSKNTRLFYIVVTVLFLALFLFSSISLIFLVFLGAFVISLFELTTKRQFLKLQTILPTSKIRSLAMGLVEISGSTSCNELIQPRIGDKKCIAYHYQVHKKVKDADGHYSSQLIEEDKKIAPFSIKDKTGSVDVSTKHLDFLWLPEEGSYSIGNLYYTQTILMPDVQVLLIGKAVNLNGKIMIEKDNINGVFNLTRVSSINKWTYYKPLLNSLYLFLGLICLVTIFIVMADVNVHGNLVIYHF